MPPPAVVVVFFFHLSESFKSTQHPTNREKRVRSSFTKANATALHLCIHLSSASPQQAKDARTRSAAVIVHEIPDPPVCSFHSHTLPRPSSNRLSSDLSAHRPTLAPVLLFKSIQPQYLTHPSRQPPTAAYLKYTLDSDFAARLQFAIGTHPRRHLSPEHLTDLSGFRQLSSCISTPARPDSLTPPVILVKQDPSPPLIQRLDHPALWSLPAHPRPGRWIISHRIYGKPP